MVQLTVRKIGNSLGVILPAEAARYSNHCATPNSSNKPGSRAARSPGPTVPTSLPRRFTKKSPMRNLKSAAHPNSVRPRAASGLRVDVT